MRIECLPLSICSHILMVVMLWAQHFPRIGFTLPLQFDPMLLPARACLLVLRRPNDLIQTLRG
ncbi:hypothetical protein BJV78DRAFT_198505 [Lactifluus subvellereus]|nr:hypothetical protein BJV78DRAFT_198505 [Lactifluus subvellereus]